MTRRVDILLAKSYDPDPRVRRTAQALIHAGYDVRVIAWDRTARRPLEERDEEIPIRRIRVRSRPSRGWTQVFFLLLVTLRCLPLVRRDRPGVLHAVNLPMLAVALALARFTGGRRRPTIVYDAFEIHALMGAQRYPRWLLAVIDVIERYLPRLADAVITPGEDRRRYFAERGLDSVSVPNWVDPPADPPSRQAAREALGIEAERFVILYTGGILASRDLGPLIAHARGHPQDLVLIAGSGDAVDDLRRLATGLRNVKLLGWVRDPTTLLAAADVLYYALKPEHPYAAHPAPNNLYQAIAHAIPLVYREQGEIAVVAAKHVIGRSFTNPASLQAAFDELRDPATNAEVRSGMRSMRDAYRWEAAAGALVNLYRGREEARRARGMARLLVITRIWPHPRRPSVGVFVRDRVAGVPDAVVVRPRWNSLPRTLIYFLLLLSALRVRGPLIGVEAHMIVPTGFVGLLVARLRGVPLIVYSHGGDVRDWWKRPWPMRYLSRLVARHADRFVTNSDDSARYVRALGADALVIPPGVDLRRFRPTPRPPVRSVLYLGGRNRRKGYAVAKELADTLVGPWLRDVDPAEVPRLIAEHAIVLMPSSAEPFGLVAVEAIASGRWVVANAVGGLLDIIEDGVNGTLVRDGNYAAAIRQVPDYDPFEIAHTVERFSLEHWQTSMAKLWDEVLDGASRR